MLRRIRSRSVALALLLALTADLVGPLPAHAPTFVKLTATTSPGSGQPGVQYINVTGSGFPSGTITPAAVTIRLAPAAPAVGPSGQTVAKSVLTLIGTTRRVTFQIPANILVAGPTTYRVTLEGSTTGGTTFQSSNGSLLTVNPPAVLADVMPTAAFQGTALAVTLTGQYTNFVQGSTKAAFGAGIRVGGAAPGAIGPVTVLSRTQARAQISIDPSAALGPRTVQAKTGVQAASKADAFTVLGPTVAALEPAQLTMAAGGTATLTVKLQNPHPSQAMHVALSSANAGIASVPAEVVLPAGASSGTFQVTGVVEGGPVTITASLNGTSATAQVTVERRPSPPALAEPLAEGTAIVGGTGLAGAQVDVQVNGALAGMGFVGNDGRFAVAVPALKAGDVVRATQTLHGLVSDPSAAVTVRAIPPAPVLTPPLVAGATSVRGSAIHDATVDIFVDGNHVVSGTAAPDGAFAIAVPALAVGQRVTATQTVAGLTSVPSAPLTVVATPPPPAVNSPLVEGSTSVAGTGVAGGTVEVFVNDASVGTTAVGGTGTWSLAVAPLIAGQKVKARQTVAGVPSAFSAEVTVVAPPPPPVVSSPLVEGSTSVSGTGTAGASVEVFVDDVSVGTTAVGGNGTWTLGNLQALVAGSKVKARQTVAQVPSAFSAEVTVVAPPPPPSVDTPQVAGSTKVTGTGTAGATVEVFVESASVGMATVANNGTWMVPLGAALQAGQKVKARQTVAQVSSAFSAEVTVVAPPPAPTVNGPLAAGGTTVSGTGIPGASLNVLRDGAPAGSTAVNPDGTWSLPVSPPLAAGQVITATQTVAGLESAPSAPVTVGPAALTRIDITPAPSATIIEGQTQQFTAKGTFSDNSVQDPLAGVTWSSDNTAVATINATGLATGVAPGTAKIRASRDNVQSPDTMLTVTPAPPRIDNFMPTSGPVGTLVTITGMHFAGATAVKFNNVPAPGFTVESTGSIKVTVPNGATTGLISVTTPAGMATSAIPFVVLPKIDSFAPTSGRVGDVIMITGTTFSAATAVKFNDVPAPGFTVVSATSITVPVPAGASTGPLSVTTAAGTATSPGHFVVLPTQDFQLSVAPNAIPIPATGQGAFHASLTGSDGFTNLATLAVSGLPAGATAAFGAGALTAGQSTMLTVLTNGTTPGSYPLTLTATGLMNGVQTTRSANVTLQVQPAGATSLAGQFLTNEDVPIPNVKVQIGTVESRTDAAGNFLLQNVPSGKQFLMIDANVAVAGFPIYQVEAGLAAGQTTVLPPFRITPPPPPERFTPFNNATQDQVFTDPRFPGVEVTLPQGATVIGWDGVPKSKLAIQRLTADKLPIPHPPGPTRSLYQIYFGTPMGGLPSAPLRVTAPNDLGLDPGDKAELWFYDAAPGVPIGSWQKAGLGTVGADGSKIASDPGVGITRFCGVCGTWCWIPTKDPDPNPKPGDPRGGEPVNLRTGLFTVDKTDLVLPGRLPVVLSRSYNPIDPFRMIPGFTLGLGPGWALSVDVALLDVSGSLKRLVLPGNSRFDFTQQADATFLNTTDALFAGAVLTIEAGGFHRLRLKDGTTWQFAGTSIAGLRLLVEQADRNGNRLTVDRSPAGTIQRIVEPTGRAIEVAYTGSQISQITDPIGRTVRYGYQGGRLATVTDPNGGVTRYTYDSDGRILTITDPKGIVFIRNEYSPLSGRVLRQVQADGSVWSFRYLVPPPPCPPNVLCYLVPIEESTESVAAGLTLTKSDVVIGTKVVDPRGNATTYRFGANVFTFVMNALGQFTTFERDARGQLLSTTDPLGRKTSFTYDSAGNVTTITDPAGNVRRFTYEPTFNRVTSITDSLGNVTTFEYDSKANLMAITDPEQNLKPEPDRLKTRIAYNQFGQPESTTDPLGNTSRFAYNAQGDLATISDPLGNTTSRTYDAVSRLIRQTDPRGAVTRFGYSPLNRLTTIIDALGGQTVFSYDPNANLLTVTDARKNTITHEYDSMDRLARRIDQLGRPETFAYDANNNLASTTDRKGQTNRFTYDRLNRRIKSEFADGAIAEFQYDAAGRLVKADDTADPHRPITLAYDLLNRLEAETAALGTVKYRYDEIGRRREMTVSGQEPVSYAYDRNSRLRNISQSPLSPVRIDYDPAGRRTMLTLPNGVSTEYKYDNVSRLTDLISRNALGPLGELKYQYDAAGNRIAVGGSFARTLVPDPVSPTDYDAANQQRQFGNRQMSFDANGNLSSLTDPSGPTQLTWDARNRLVALNAPGTAAAFAYDSLERRASKQINGQIAQYVYDSLDAVQERAAGTPVNYLRSLKIDELLVSSKDEHYLADVLGSAIALTDPAGAARTEYTFESFGQALTMGAPAANPYQYTGRENDELGLYYYRSRYYSPSLRRFVSEDPIRFGDVINLYEYVEGNPINLVDPLGLEARIPGLLSTSAIPGSPFIPGIPGLFSISAIPGSPFTPGSLLPPPPPNCFENPWKCIAEIMKQAADEARKRLRGNPPNLPKRLVPEGIGGRKDDFFAQQCMLDFFLCMEWGSADAYADAFSRSLSTFYGFYGEIAYEIAYAEAFSRSLRNAYRRR